MFPQKKRTKYYVKKQFISQSSYYTVEKDSRYSTGGTLSYDSALLALLDVLKFYL